MGFVVSAKIGRGRRLGDKFEASEEFVAPFSQPGKPKYNVFSESFHGKFRAEYLNTRWFVGLGGALASAPQPIP
ncbi:integrase core domain-containing protein [Shimia abyssi]|uniref:Integrase-like protein n=1 Tax=Shimia abyssi TaxID=1662395 RepID=A0A2P8F116_9RHOB|nr:integrase-like protein [Shimia abyssi]